MSTSEQQTIYSCSRCNYFSERKYNYRRHLDKVHNIKDENNDKRLSGENVCQDGENVCPGGENVCPDGENVCPGSENVCPGGENVYPGGENVSTLLFCIKCNKKYNSQRYLSNHESTCKGFENTSI